MFYCDFGFDGWFCMFDLCGAVWITGLLVFAVFWVLVIDCICDCCGTV